ncbi:MAG TPA: helix-turn-helix domain-containing protein, partial [Chthoniobacterales bacterium]|nr:helix-turn-helix domain-containing protein [Chthoniobacterales bacterium]
EQIAHARGFVRTTILDHLVRAIEAGVPLTIEQFFDRTQTEEIAAAFEQAGAKNLVGVREQLGGKFEIGELRIFRALAAQGGLAAPVSGPG